MPLPSPIDVIAFWREAGENRWYTRDDALDAEVTRRFLTVWESARDGALDGWQLSADGSLALVLVLDQFPRNMFRQDARAFSTDGKALGIAEAAIVKGFDQQIAEDLRAFIYMPFMHAEDMATQERCVALFRAFGNANNLKYAELHLDIIRRFGRFPHRNIRLGRKTTPDEQAYLDSGGFSG